MNDQLIYWLVVGAGAFTLLVEAFRSFNAPNGKHPFELHPILQQVEARNLCTNGEIISGFVFYAGMYLVLYAAILGSVEVYTLVSHATGVKTTVGAVSSAEDFGDYGKPIYVSALLISFLSIGPVKPVERTMRSFAHRLAGIPRGVYRVIESLHAFDFEQHCAQMPSPLKAQFAQKIGNNATGADLPHHIEEIYKSLTAIDCLALATRTDSRTLYFPLYRISQLIDLLATLDQEHRELSKAIAELPQLGTSNANGTTTQQAYIDFARKAAIIRENTMALFAVMFVRNNRSIFSLQQILRKSDDQKPTGKNPTNPIEEIKNFIQNEYNAEQNAFAVAFVIVCIPAFFCVIASYYIANFIFDSGSGLNFEAVVSTSFWDCLRSSAMIFCSVLFVVSAREMRIEQQSWNTNWKLHQIPFLRMLSLSIFSGIAAIFSYPFIDMVQLMFDVDFKVTTTQITFLFQQNGLFYILRFGAGLILAFAALVIMDKHDQLPAKQTCLIATLFAFIYLTYMLLTNFALYGDNWTYREGRDAIIFAIMPGLFLVLFAGFLEYSEGPGRSFIDRRKSNSTDHPSPTQVTP